MMADLEMSDWPRADIITFSGSGEPTLALNLGEAIRRSADFTKKPVLVLTNGTLWGSDQVREELSEADQVFLKLDAASEDVFQRVNRPVQGVTLEKIIDAGVQFRKEYSGKLGVQMMFVYPNLRDVKRFAEILNRIQPDEVQVNTPTRPYPSGWYLASRGSHEGVDYPAKPLKQVSPEELSQIVHQLRERTGLRITSVHPSD
jgi:wyosine [tRNA(Phe)-imidazoG37] synthetase (radical SAM superfamily)